MALVAQAVVFGVGHLENVVQGGTGDAVAMLVSVLLGAVAQQSPALAAGLGVLVAALLWAKAPLRRLSQELISEREVQDGLLLAASALVILPLLPDRGFGPYAALNPFRLWLAVILIATLSLAGQKMGKHPVDVMLDMAVEENLETEFFAAPPNGSIEYLKELVDDPYILFGVSDGGAHTKFLTAGRYPTETICKVVRQHGMLMLGPILLLAGFLAAVTSGYAFSTALQQSVSDWNQRRSTRILATISSSVFSLEKAKTNPLAMKSNITISSRILFFAQLK